MGFAQLTRVFFISQPQPVLFSIDCSWLDAARQQGKNEEGADLVVARKKIQVYFLFVRQILKKL